MNQQDPIARLIQRGEKLKSDRSQFETLVQEVLEYFQPEKASVTAQRPPGTLDMRRVFDATPILAKERLANTVHGMLYAPSTPWLNIRMVEEELNDIQENRLWLQFLVDLMRRETLNSNFHTQVHEFLIDQVTAGTGNMFMDEWERPDGLWGLRFWARHFSECVVAENHQGYVDTVARTFMLGARQAIKKFGAETVSQTIKQKDESGHPDDEDQYQHWTLPIEDWEGEKVPGGHRWASVYIDLTDKKVVRLGGFHSWPWAVARWMKLTAEICGRSPAMSALPDVRMLNQAAETTIRAAMKKTDPALLMPDDGVLRPLRVGPAALNYYNVKSADAGKIIGQLPSGSPELGLEFLQYIREQVREAFHSGLLDIKDSPQMTAYEFSARLSQQAQLLGPILGRQNSEFLQPLVDRQFGLLWQQGKIPEPPESMRGQPLMVEYTSPLAKAQKQHEFVAMQNIVAGLAALSQFDPDVKDNYDLDVMARQPHELFGGPADALRSEEERNKLRVARAQQAQMAEQAGVMQEALAAGKVGAEAQKTMAEAQAVREKTRAQQPGFDMGALAA